MTYQISKETQDKLTAFQAADGVFRKAWDDFEQQAKQYLEYLDKLREDRNVKLDTAVRALREEASQQSITEVKSIRSGQFTVQKKWSDFYIPERFVAILKEKGLYDKAKENGAIEEQVVINYGVAKAFVSSIGEESSFAEAEDGRELTPAVTGPKPIPPFGIESKDRK